MELIIGVDVGKAMLDAHVDGLKITEAFANTPAGVLALAARMDEWQRQGHEIKRILCEATGGYERTLVDGLQKVERRVDVVHATHVRDFARACGQWAKTDRIDAGVIARYGHIMQPRGTQLETTPEQLQMRRLLSRRQSLIDARIAETNRLDKTLPEVERASIDRHIKWLKTEIKLLETAVNDVVAAHPFLVEKVILLASIPGIGRLTAMTLLAELPELQKWDLPQLTSLVGLAPYNRDSGRFKGKRHIQGGRAVPRRALYMAALASTRHNPQIKAYYRHLRDAGKPAKLALIACAHKLLAFLHAVAKRNSPWIVNPA
jgi:transposase